MAESIAHKGDVMHIKFHGGRTYEYKGVSAKDFEALKGAKSFGKHLNGMKITGKNITK